MGDDGLRMRLTKMELRKTRQECEDGIRRLTAEYGEQNAPV